MKTLALSIDDTILDRHPDMRVLGFRVDELDRTTGRLGTDRLDADALGGALAARGLDPQRLTDDDRLRAWREAIAACGLKPSRYRGSVEQLVRRVLGGKSISTPLPIVTTYCAVSVRNLTPLGGYDVARLPEPEIRLRPGDPELDRFEPLGGDAGAMPITERVAVYGAGHTVLCYAYNHRDARDTCLTLETTSAVFVGEAVAACQHEGLHDAVAELHERLEHAGAHPGDVTTVDAGTPRATVG
ncbi:MAG: B3/B4 domain-containing protein [Planctomycetota bacterium]|jgi:DNA/RNA-binding domain of Phe-tRNA-synthetase-like protein